MTHQMHEYPVFHNAKVQKFPLCGLKKTTICSKSIFREQNLNLITENKPKHGNSQKTTSKVEPMKVRLDNIRRARQKALHIAMLTSFTHFITWTLDKRKINCCDLSEVNSVLKTFLKNCALRYDLTYLVVPELHKSGAIHMHGLINGNMKLVDSGHRYWGGRIIYNMPQWKYGWTTAIPMHGDQRQIAYYLTKHINDTERRILGNYYYAGGNNLVRKPETELCDLNYDEVIVDKVYSVPYTELCFKYLDEEYVP